MAAVTGRSRSYAALQLDGDLVLFDASGLPLWHSGSAGAAVLVMQDDGNLVLYRLDGTPQWANLAPPTTGVSRGSPPPPSGWW